MADSRYEHESSERVPGGLRLRGRTHMILREDNTIEVRVSDDGRAVRLLPWDVTLPPDDALFFAAEVIKAANKAKAAPSDSTWSV